MIDPLIPSTLAALPQPWNLSDTYASSAGIKALPRDDEQRRIAAAALEHCLAYLTDDYDRYGDEPSESLPEQFYETWWSFDRRSAERMPTLSDVSLDAFRQWLATDVDLSVMFGEPWSAPPADVVQKVGTFWVRATIRRVTMDLLRWLRRAYLDRPDAPDKHRFLSVLEAAAPRLNWVIGQRAVAVAWDLTKPEGREFLATMAHHPEAPERTREEATRLLEYADQQS